MTKYPRSASELADLEATARQFILPGHMPPRPFLNLQDKIWTAGSCFAENIAQALAARNVNVMLNHVIEAANSPLVLRTVLENAVKEIPPYDEINRFIKSASAAILTIGVGAAAFDSKGNVVIAQNQDVAEWRALRFSDCLSDISRSVAAIMHMNPAIHVFLTLSPVPLNRSPWNASPIVADCISKSMLRTALDEYFVTAPEQVHYWPAFEIVRWLGAHRPNHYGGDDGLQRHVSKSVVDTVIGLFIEEYFIS